MPIKHPFVSPKADGGDETLLQPSSWNADHVVDVVAPTGLTGATAASRYVGGTASGAPASGTFAIGDFVIDRTGKIYICTTAGSPGTWNTVSGGGSAVSCRVRRAASQSVGSGIYTPDWEYISFDTEDIDNGGMWTIGSPLAVTFPVDGLYLVSAVAGHDGASGSQSDTIIGINAYSSGGVKQGLVSTIRVSTVYDQTLSITGSWLASSGQYVKLFVYQTTGSTRSYTASLAAVKIG